MKNDTAAKDLAKIKEHWEDPKTVSLKDKNLQALEKLYILRALKKIGRVPRLADIGCGDGTDTRHWRRFADEVFGYDYSSTMLEKASKATRNSVVLTQFDLLEEEIDRVFDIAITKRCLINLGSFRNQKEAILNIHRSLKKGGYYLMLECSLDGLNGLNRYRKGLGLESLKKPFHNSYFRLKELMPFLDKLFYIKESRGFSAYYFLTRVFSQLCDKNNYGRMDEAAREIQENTDILNNETIGPQFFLVLKRK